MCWKLTLNPKQSAFFFALIKVKTTNAAIIVVRQIFGKIEITN